MDPVGKNLELLQVVSDPAFRISGQTNKMLGHVLAGPEVTFMVSSK
jgi:hypothetical protein